MRIKVSRCGRLSGIAHLPGDKSISHRAALLSALVEGESYIKNFLYAGVTEVMLDALCHLGVEVHCDGSSLKVNSPGLLALKKPSSPIDCGHSGTTIRMLAGVLTAANLDVILDGSEQLRNRPMDRIVNPLRRMGANIITNDGKAPLVLSERQICSSLKSLVHELPVASAQVKSAILLAGLRSEGSTVVVEPKPSRDHTERMLAAMGVNIQQERLKDGQYQISLQPPDVTKLLPLNLSIPGDFSAAAFLLAAGCIVMNSELHLLGVGMNWTRLGMLSALEDMGAQIQLENRAVDSNEEFGDLKIQYASLQGGNIEKTLVVRMIDEFPAFAVVAAFAEGQTIVRGAEELRYKESDRIRGICRGLSKLGVEIKETSDGFILNGSNKDLPGGITLNPNHDHRMAMAYVLAGLRCSNPIIIEDGQIIAQSFPGFIETLVSLGVGSIEVVDD